jgi:cell pole-organizing protein PopZ
MSKPDPAGGSLENILASIRKSLSEQSPDALAEASAAPAEQDKDTKPPRKQGLTQRLAGTTAEAPLLPNAGGASDDLSDLLDDGPAKATPAGAPASAAEGPAAATGAASGEKDPLWFLTRRDEPAPEAGSPPAGAAPESPPPPAAAAPPAEPKLTRPEVLRASMPPFFGSSTEAQSSLTSETTVPPATGPHVTRPQSAAPVAQASADAGMAREVSLLAAAAEAAAARPPQAAPPQPVLNGKAAPSAAAPSPSSTLASDMAHNRALEVMVLDLLKPMLRQWLDENMPRMVAEALSEEVQRARTAKGDAKKT